MQALPLVDVNYVHFDLRTQKVLESVLKIRLFEPVMT